MLGLVIVHRVRHGVEEVASIELNDSHDRQEPCDHHEHIECRKDPEKVSVDEAKALVEDAEIDGPLIDWKTKGSMVEYLGTEDVDGTLAHKLRVVRKNGDVNYVYLDPDHFLEIRIITQRMENGAKVENETDLGDYEKINGVFFPFSLEGGPKGSTDKQKVIFEKAEANTPVDDTIFKFPTTASK